MASPQTGFDIENLGEIVKRLDKSNYLIHQGTPGVGITTIGTFTATKDMLISKIYVKSQTGSGIGHGDASANFCEFYLQTNESGSYTYPFKLRMAANSVLYQLVPKNKLYRLSAGNQIVTRGKRGTSALPYLVVTYVFSED
jgi:hypothetical protein